MTVFPRIPIKYVTTYNDEVLPEAFDPDSMINYIEISDVDSSVGISGSITVSFAEAPSRARRIVRKGDVLVSTVRTYLRAIASVDREYDGSIASTGFCVLRPADVHPGFLKYATSSPDFIEEVIARSAGISYPAINATDLVRLSIPAPSQKEQTRISSFLDRETAQIDELIGKQERLIELLAEKRRAIITHAVTKGLDPAAPTKPSGVPWLGDVNATWPLRPLKAAGHISLGKMIQPNPKQDDDFEAPYLRAANVQPHGTLALDDVKTMWFNSSELRSLDVRTGDVVVVEGGVGGFGRAAYVNRDLFGFGYQNSITRIRPFKSVDGRFLTYLLLTARHSGYIHAYCTGVSMPHLTAEKLAAIIVPLPNRTTQIQISDHIDEEVGRINAISEQASAVVSILRERRSALISAAVTGKIDVREGVV